METGCWMSNIYAMIDNLQSFRFNIFNWLRFPKNLLPLYKPFPSIKYVSFGLIMHHFGRSPSLMPSHNRSGSSHPLFQTTGCFQ